MDNITVTDSEPEKAVSEDNKENDVPDVQELICQLKILKLESQQFSVQRAKMKELFVVKEAEEKKLKDDKKLLEQQMEEVRCRVVELGIELETERAKTQEELNNLQELLNETLEESTARGEELKLTKQRCTQLEDEMEAFKNDLSERSPLLATPSAVLSNIVKKVSQLGGSDLNTSNNESLEESMRKAQEDTEVLKSLLVPLEEEIVALKGKLRETDTELMKYKQREYAQRQTLVNGLAAEGTLPSEDADSSDGSKIYPEKSSCEMCLNYERQLVAADEKARDLEKELSTLERVKQELAKEMAFRKQMEDKWNEKKETHKVEIESLEERLKTVESTLSLVHQNYESSCKKLETRFVQLAKERESVEKRLDRLQRENETLAGKYGTHSRELQNQIINLPDNIEELQLIWLKQNDELIKARVGLETNEGRLKEYMVLCSELNDKYKQSAQMVALIREDVQKKGALIEDQIKQLDKMSFLKDEINRLKTELTRAQQDNNQLKSDNQELKNRLASLQTGLENGEAVQKDFVLLSQNLQKELEHLRVQNNSLRWEFEDDVHQCRGCEQPFKQNDRGKSNCRHCGRLFCGSCLSHRIVTNGPSKREAKVCTVCHTLLDKNTPPYFSTEPPK